jgi:hypothetical protein
MVLAFFEPQFTFLSTGDRRPALLGEEWEQQLESGAEG